MPRALKVWLALGGVLLVLGLGWGVSFALDPTKAYDAHGPSMEPTLFDGDDFDVSLEDTPIERGAVVVARSPYDDTPTVKRVVALGGETVRILDDDCAIEVDGVRFDREPIECPDRLYGGASGTETERRCFREHGPSGPPYPILFSEMVCRVGPVEVPEGHVFLLGDHRNRSNDSTNPMFGPVPLDRVVGVVRLDD